MEEALMSEVDNRLRHTSDEGLLKTFAVLTHRLHAADRGHTAAAPLLREQRRLVQVEILERMARGAERAHTTHVPAPCRAIPEEGL
jgi:hypothetical protein